MDLGAHEGDLQMPMSGGFAGLNETSKLKLVTSGNGTGTEESVRPSEGIANNKVKKIVKYRECLKNHAASIGGHAIDGCGEFMPAGEEGTADALKCAACECHRNFHHREVEGEPPACDCQHTRKEKNKRTPGSGGAAAAGGGGGGAGSGGMGSPQTALALPSTNIALAARAPAPAALMVSNGPAESDDQDGGVSLTPAAIKKRFRTKFSAEQKEKMSSFADKLGWKIQKHDEAAVQAFCADVGVKRHVLKVWMHNNKQGRLYG